MGHTRTSKCCSKIKQTTKNRKHKIYMKYRSFLSILPVFPALFCVSCMQKDERSDVESYIDILKECRDEADFHSELLIFPETIEGKEVRKFAYAHRSDLFTGSFLMYLVLEYKQEDFAPELERISNVNAEFKTGEKKGVISYPENKLYLAIKQNARFEYAIYDESTFEIAYVSNQIFDWDETPVESKYIIPDVVIPTELVDRDDTYNMYYLYDGDVGIYCED